MDATFSSDRNPFVVSVDDGVIQARDAYGNTHYVWNGNIHRVLFHDHWLVVVATYENTYTFIAARTVNTTFVWEFATTLEAMDRVFLLGHDIDNGFAVVRDKIMLHVYKDRGHWLTRKQAVSDHIIGGYHYPPDDKVRFILERVTPNVNRLSVVDRVDTYMTTAQELHVVHLQFVLPGTDGKMYRIGLAGTKKVLDPSKNVMDYQRHGQFLPGTTLPRDNAVHVVPAVLYDAFHNPAMAASVAPLTRNTEAIIEYVNAVIAEGESVVTHLRLVRDHFLPQRTLDAIGARVAAPKAATGELITKEDIKVDELFRLSTHEDSERLRVFAWAIGSALSGKCVDSTDLLTMEPLTEFSNEVILKIIVYPPDGVPVVVCYRKSSLIQTLETTTGVNVRLPFGEATVNRERALNVLKTSYRDVFMIDNDRLRVIGYEELAFFSEDAPVEFLRITSARWPNTATVLSYYRALIRADDPRHFTGMTTFTREALAALTQAERNALFVLMMQSTSRPQPKNVKAFLDQVDEVGYLALLRMIDSVDPAYRTMIIHLPTPPPDYVPFAARWPFRALPSVSVWMDDWSQRNHFLASVSSELTTFGPDKRNPRYRRWAEQLFNTIVGNLPEAERFVVPEDLPYTRADILALMLDGIAPPAVFNTLVTNVEYMTELKREQYAMPLATFRVRLSPAERIEINAAMLQFLAFQPAEPR